MAVIDGVIRMDVRVINAPETRFNRHAWLQWNYGRL